MLLNKTQTQNLIFSSPSLFSRAFRTVLTVPIAIDNPVTFIFPSWFVFSALWQDPSICLTFCFYFFFHSDGMTKSTSLQVFSFYYSILGLVFWLGFGDPT